MYRICSDMGPLRLHGRRRLDWSTVHLGEPLIGP
jgi:hypothetical protein